MLARKTQKTKGEERKSFRYNRAMKSIPFFIVLGIMIAGVVSFVVMNTGDDEDSAALESNSSPTLPIDSANDTSETSAPIDEAQPLEEAELSAVDPYTGSGTATRTVSGRFIHEVVAQLGDPAPGDFYEGWLVGPSVVSTGELMSEGDGEWSLTFTTGEDLSMHDRIVITEETLANGLDGIPEDHVLEGSF